MRRFDAFMVNLVREHPQGWRVGTSILYGALLAWYLWDVVHRHPWWGVDYASAALVAAAWGVMATMWGRHDRSDEIQEHVTEAMGDSDIGNAVWVWSYNSSSWWQRDVLQWMRTHDITQVHVDDMPPSVRDLAKFVVLLRS